MIVSNLDQDLIKWENRYLRSYYLRYVLNYLNNELYVNISPLAKEAGISRQLLHSLLKDDRTFSENVSESLFNIIDEKYHPIKNNIISHYNIEELKAFLEEYYDTEIEIKEMSYPTKKKYGVSSKNNKIERDDL